ncbi:tyrosine-type recombinase/integrase [Aeromonas hydrophila]|jgi:site-specific recombinase XerD|uniref:phage integrase n=1 Tax=Aeromonas TaxID=642 RepID=UPI001116A980|nr:MULTISPECIES: tyrosine-type recombinase/integrase [Aeromonas]MCX4042107.1 tyrosine-type recombinase/integrase [Aeromonas hydrophila]MDD9209790.1 tyrosine-type recombinase/integrase [Aeromonas dhakensis]NLR35518.1 tyrosine-type recombinase/integrase [Aeromonas hydrophila]TNI18328.1 integrase [Aeromonas dhakensis]
MSIKKLDDGQYQVDVRPTGRKGKRIRRRFSKKHEAVAFERHVLATQHDKPWQSKLADARTLAELIEIWWAHKGQYQKWGTHARRTLLRADRYLGEVRVNQLNAHALTLLRSRMLAAGITPNSVNRLVVELSGMFNFLIEGGFYRGENPVREVKALKVAPREMSYLSPSEVQQLLAGLSGDDRGVAVLCLSTGARWSEASTVRAEHVVNRRVTFVATKNGKNRTVPISAEVEAEWVANKRGVLFPKANYLRVREMLKVVKPDLPKGQAVHALRHTFATHFMANGGNILVLQRILGHASIQQTMTYAHFAPDFLQDAVQFNPLRGGAG